jgi:hypothetical protein
MYGQLQCADSPNTVPALNEVIHAILYVPLDIECTPLMGLACLGPQPTLKATPPPYLLLL